MGSRRRGGSDRRRTLRRVGGERNWGPIIVGMIVVGVLAAFAAVVVADLSQRAASSPPDDVETFDVGTGGRHTEGAVAYDQSPPAGGKHNPVWLNAGFYDEPVRNELAVHTLEHGGVWITYSPDLPADEVEIIRDLVRGQECVLASPYPNLDSPVVASAWGKQLRLEAAEDPDLERFVRAFQRGPQTPEPGAACTGGTGEPL